MLKIPETLTGADGLVIAVNTGNGLFVIEISLGDGSQWLPEDDEEYPDCDGYLTGTVAHYAGGSETAELFREFDGIWFAFSTDEYPDWHDALLPCLKDLFESEGVNPVYTVLAAAE